MRYLIHLSKEDENTYKLWCSANNKTYYFKKYNSAMNKVEALKGKFGSNCSFWDDIKNTPEYLRNHPFYR